MLQHSPNTSGTSFEAKLNKLAKNGTISRAGRQWLHLALNPFSDETLPSGSGFPDSSKDASVVRVLNLEQTISFTGSASTYDVHFFNMPCNETARVYGQTISAFNCSNTPDTLQTDIGGNLNIGLMNALVVPSGVTLTDGLTGATGATITVGGATSGSNDFVLGLRGSTGAPPIGTTKGRVIGGGFKVSNVTPYNDAGGSVVHWRQSTDITQGALSQNAATVKGHTSAYFMRGPPRSEAEATAMINHTTGLAKDGTYMPFILGDKPKVERYSSGPMIIQWDGDVAAHDVWATGAIAELNAAAPHYRSVNELDMAGALYTGLPANTVLKLSVRVFYEEFPANTDAAITLARKSAALDDEVWQLYKHITAAMYNSAHFADNDKGEWWKHVSTIGSALIPFAGQYAPLISAALAVGNAYQTAHNNTGNTSKHLRQGRPVPGPRPSNRRGR